MAPSRTSSTVRQFCESDSRFCADSSRGAALAGQVLQAVSREQAQARVKAP